jgi:hypothetical protein
MNPTRADISPRTTMAEVPFMGPVLARLVALTSKVTEHEGGRLEIE